MRWILAAMFAGLLAIAVPTVVHGQERPPECKTVPMADGNYTIKVTFCGMGSGSEYPIRPSVKSLILDGGFNHKHIYIFWPGSYAS
jgi:hypothetical protein